ncbi:hypothetical protein ACIA5G_00445 [Amycolatopsis sp. NPDC051758]|uniref:hypothetical protein n=1 Tax=Amycolatopsis sp. NPDC051758 TaxID=3363935 RepID=UPI0037A9ABDA
MDSTIARAHQHAAVRGKGDLQAEPPGGVTVEPGDHALGRYDKFAVRYEATAQIAAINEWL